MDAKKLRQRYVRAFIKRAPWFAREYGPTAYYSRPRPYPIAEEVAIMTPWADLAGAPAVLPKADIVAVTWFSEGEGSETLLRRQLDLREILGDRCEKMTEPLLHFLVEELSDDEKDDILSELRALPEPPLFGGTAHVSDLARRRAENEARAERALRHSSDSSLIESTMPSDEALSAMDYFEIADETIRPLLSSLYDSLGRLKGLLGRGEKRRALVRSETMSRLDSVREAVEGLEPEADQEEIHDDLRRLVDELHRTLAGDLAGEIGDIDLEERLGTHEKEIHAWRTRIREEESEVDL